MNPDVKKLRDRTNQYKQDHPEFRKGPEKHPKRRKMRTKKRLKPGTRCAYCGKLLSTHTATIDHIVPLSKGGTYDPDNLCWCCKKCNSAKGSKLYNEWEDQSCM